MKLTQDIDLNQTGTRDIIQTCREGRQTFICVGQGQGQSVCVTLCLWSDIGAKLRGGEAENLDSLRIFRVRGILPMTPSGPTRPDCAFALTAAACALPACMAGRRRREVAT